MFSGARLVIAWCTWSTRCAFCAVVVCIVLGALAWLVRNATYELRLAFALGLGLGPGSSPGPGELSFCYFSVVDSRVADCGCCLADLHPSLSNPEDNRTGRRGGGLECDGSGRDNTARKAERRTAEGLNPHPKLGRAGETAMKPREDARFPNWAVRRQRPALGQSSVTMLDLAPLLSRPSWRRYISPTGFSDQRGNLRTA